MKIFKPIVVLLFTSLAGICVFSQTNRVLNYIPADAKMIMKINPASLREKIKWEDLLQYKMFEDFMQQTPEEGKDFLNNPAHTGIDLSQGFFLVASEDKINQKTEASFYGVLKDEAQFAAMIKKLNPEKKIAKIRNGNLVIDKNTAFAWNHEIFVVTENKSEQDTVNGKSKAEAELKRTEQLTEKCKSILSKRTTALNNQQFLSLLHEQGDMLLWINNTVQSQRSKNSKIPEAFGMLNKSLMRKGNYVSGVINFENGKIVVKMKQYVSESTDSFYKKYPLKNVNTELLRKLPNGHPIFLCSFSFSPKMMIDLYAKAGADKIIDSASNHKIKVDEILPAIKGDITLALMKADEVGDEDSATKALNGIELFVAGHIGDKEKFKNVNALLQNKKPDSLKNNSAKKPRPFVFSNDSIFVVSLSPVAGQKFLESPGNNEEIEKMIEPYENNPSAVIIDLRTIFGFAMQSALKNKTEEEAKKASEVLGMFDKIIGYGGQHDDHSVITNMELTLTNKDENSLKQFMNLIDLLYSLKPKKSVAFNEVPIR